MEWILFLKRILLDISYLFVLALLMNLFITAGRRIGFPHFFLENEEEKKLIQLILSN